MKCVCILLTVQIVISVVKGVTDLPRIDRFLTSIYEHPDPNRKQDLLDRLQLYVTTLRRYNAMVKKDCPETCEEASELVHSGGPEFLKTHPFYSDEEQKFRAKMNFTDFQFQEYQYYRLDTENEWSELKDQVAHLDRDKEKARNMQRPLEGIVVFLSLITKVLVISVENDLLEINRKLNNLDEKIVSFLNDPDCTMRDDFIQWFEDYNTNLCQLVSYLNDHDVRAEPIARKLLLKNGPSFLKAKINTEYLKERLYWGEADIEEMYYNIGATKVLWFEMKNVLSPFGERHLRNINVPRELYELDIRGRLNEDIHFTNTGDINDPKTNFSHNFPTDVY